MVLAYKKSADICTVLAALLAFYLYKKTEEWPAQPESKRTQLYLYVNFTYSCQHLVGRHAMKEKDDKTYSISELSREFDITTRSIRFYEDQGLLTPQRNGQTRIYSKRDRVRLKLILRGKRLGFSLAETGQLFELYDADKSSVTQLSTMLKLIEHKKSELHQQLDDIKVVLMELVTVEKRCRETLTEAQQQKTTTSSAK